MCLSASIRFTSSRLSSESECGTTIHANQIEDPVLDVNLRQRRQVDQLKRDVLVGHHPGLRLARREGVVRDLGFGVGHPGDERRLSAVGRSDERDLPRALLGDVVAVAARTLRLRLQLEFRDPRLDARLELLRPLVLGDDAQHLFERSDLIVRGLGRAESLLGLVVSRWKVGRHVSSTPVNQDTAKGVKGMGTFPKPRFWGQVKSPESRIERIGWFDLSPKPGFGKRPHSPTEDVDELGPSG
jgi:hypothetical protein